jgi:hypothetical protein
LNKKRRESYQRRKGNATLSIMITHTHTPIPWFFLSLVFTVGQNACGSRLGVVNPIILRNQRVEPAVHQCLLREEINKKHGESYQRKKGKPKLLKPKNGDTT